MDDRYLKYLIGFIIAMIALYIVLSQQGGLAITKVKSNLIQTCPDEWILNKMPSIRNDENPLDSNDLPSEYFIIDGKRRELTEFDLLWIQSNCDIKQTSVY